MLNILVIYDASWYQMCTVKDYIDSFAAFSKFKIFYHKVGQPLPVPIQHFDVVVSHWSIRLCYENKYEKSVREILEGFNGLRAVFVQDEYEHTLGLRDWIDNNNIHMVFTVVPESGIEKVYGEPLYHSTQFVSLLTGYVPIDQKIISNFIKPLTQRSTVIGYRGRTLNHLYGTLAYEKRKIGEGVKAYAQQNNINVDIEVDEQSRIYGHHWYEFLGSCISTLGSESGCNIFYFDDPIYDEFRGFLNDNPNASFDEVYPKYIEPIEEQTCKMNQISPKIFEVISLKTALVLFEGEYSDILEPHKHYLPLKKDFSNLPDIMKTLTADNLSPVQEMIDTVYEDVVLSGRYSYQSLIEQFDAAVESFFDIPGKAVFKGRASAASKEM